MASSVWKGHLSFGLVSIPVRLIRAARAERVRLHQLQREAAAAAKRGPADVIELPAPSPSPEPERARAAGRGELRQAPPPAPAVAGSVERVRQVAVTADEERPVPAGELVKGFEYQPDQWVVIAPEEVKRLAPKTSKTLQIVEFVPAGEVDPLYLESSYYLVPERTGEKAYALLYAALREKGFAAVAEVAMHGREHVLILRGGRTGIVAHTMYFENEVHREEEYRAGTTGVGRKELELAHSLIAMLAGHFEPEKYRDNYRERLEALIAEKLQGGDVAQERQAEPPKPPALDLAEALRKSVEAIRKPPASAAPKTAGGPKKRAERRGHA